MSVSIHHESLLVLALCHDTMSLVGDVRIQFLLIELAVHVHNVIYCWVSTARIFFFIIIIIIGRVGRCVSQCSGSCRIRTERETEKETYAVMCAGNIST